MRETRYSGETYITVTPAIGRLWGIQIQKEVKSNTKQPSSKKSAALRQVMVKKDVKSKVEAKKWL